MDSLSARFSQLLQRKIRYAVLVGHEGLPHHLDQPIIMLFEPPSGRIHDASSSKSLEHIGLDREIVTVLCLELVGEPENVTYTITAGVKKQNITLIPKGRGFMPEAFESRLLSSVMRYQDVIAVPTPEAHLPALFYHKMYHTDWLKTEKDSTLIELVKRYVSRVVGIKMTCEIPQFKGAG